jgi:hypothetical protein
MTPEEFIAANADADGNVDSEKMAEFLDGNFDDGDTIIEEAPDLDKETETPEVVVLAKDGVHTMPFSVVEELRESLKLSNEKAGRYEAMLEEKTGLLEQLKKAEKIDTEEGNTDATEEVLSDLEIEFPGVRADILKLITPLKSEIESLKQARQQEEEARKTETAMTSAQKAFNTEIERTHPDYLDISRDDKFWGWFEKQPAYIKASQRSSEPQVIVDILSLYKSQTAPASDKTEKGTPETMAARVVEALAKAEKKSVVRSLSDIPGGSSPEHDEKEAFHKMSPMEQMDKLMSMPDQKARDNLLRRMM